MAPSAARCECAGPPWQAAAALPLPGLEPLLGRGGRDGKPGFQISRLEQLGLGLPSGNPGREADQQLLAAPAQHLPGSGSHQQKNQPRTVVRIMVTIIVYIQSLCERHGYSIGLYLVWEDPRSLMECLGTLLCPMPRKLLEQNSSLPQRLCPHGGDHAVAVPPPLMTPYPELG